MGRLDLLDPKRDEDNNGKAGSMKRKAIIVGVLAVVVAVVAAVALAWYSGSGSSAPTQAGTAGTAPLAVTVTVNGGTTAMYPGDSVPFDGDIAAGTHRAHVNGVSAALDSSSLPAGCSSSWFDVSAALDGGPQTIPANGSASFTGSLTFTDEDLSQDACSAADLSVVVSTTP